MNENQPTEFRLKGSSKILEYLKKFSATEKVIFAIFALAALVTAVIMTVQANSYFMIEVPASGGTLHEGLVGLPHNINPVLALTDVDRDISSLVYAGLTKTEGEKILPDLAESWTISPDGLTYTFKLRSNISFQDSKPLTAYDVVFTIEKIKDPLLKSPRASDWAGVNATATSPITIEFTLRQPYSSFIANTNVGIIPMHVWGKVGIDQFLFNEYNLKPIGSGPYRINSIDRDQGGIPTDYHLEVWNKYHGKKPKISYIKFTFFPDLEHAVKAVGNNSIDSLSSVPPAVASELASNKTEPYKIVSAPLTRIFGVFLNQNKNAVLTDPIVRKALDMSVDRSTMIKTVLDGYGVSVFTALPSQIGGPVASSSIDRFDIQAAQSLLIKNGWKLSANGLLGKKASKNSATTTISFTLYTADTADLKQAAELLKANWKTLGADVTVKVFEPSELYQNVIRTREYDALLFGQSVGEATDLYAFWHSSQRNAPGLNIAMYTNSKVDKLLENIRAATSTDSARAQYGLLNSLISADIPAIFLYSPKLTYVVPKTLRGVDLGVITAPFDRFEGISKWYIETERVWNFFVKNE